MIMLMSSFTMLASAGLPSIPALLLLLVVFLAPLLYRLSSAPSAGPRPLRGGDLLLVLAAMLYFITLSMVMGLGDPVTHKSAGVHQPIGPAHLMATDMLGFERRRFLDPFDYVEDFNFNCIDAVPESSSEHDPLDWYIICGARHTNYLLYSTSVSTIAFFGIILYSYALGVYTSNEIPKGKCD